MSENPALRAEYPRFANWQIEGNKRADDLATLACVGAQVSQQSAEGVLFLYDQLIHVQKRLVAILNSLERRPKRKPVDRLIVQPPTFSDMCKESEHNVSRDGKLVKCSRCLESVLASSPSLKQWLRSPCVPNPTLVIATTSSSSLPVRVPPAARHAVLVAGRCLHHSHRLCLITELCIYYCDVCGAYASRQPRLLGKPCLGHLRPGYKCLRESLLLDPQDALAWHIL